MDVIFEIANKARTIFRKLTTATLYRNRRSTPLHLAIIAGSASEEIIELIQKHPEDINVMDSTGRFPIHLCIEHNANDSVIEEILKISREAGFERICDEDNDNDNQTAFCKIVSKYSQQNAISLALLYNKPISTINILLKYNPYVVSYNMRAFHMEIMDIPGWAPHQVNYITTSPLEYTLWSQNSHINFNTDTVDEFSFTNGAPPIPTQALQIENGGSQFLSPQQIVRNYTPFMVAALRDVIDTGKDALEKAFDEEKKLTDELVKNMGRSRFGVSAYFDSGRTKQANEKLIEFTYIMEQKRGIMEDSLRTYNKMTGREEGFVATNGIEQLVTPEEEAMGIEIQKQWKRERTIERNWDQRKNYALFLVGSGFREGQSNFVTGNGATPQDMAFKSDFLAQRIGKFIGGKSKSKKRKATSKKRKATSKKRRARKSKSLRK